ncbi:putative siderophore biosynthesis protein SbnA [compost metagenome]
MLGCATFVKEQQLDTKIVAVDAVGSVILGGTKGKRFFPGLGAGIAPPFSETKFMDHAIQVNEADMVAGCRMLVQHEAILAGPSSGAVVYALKEALLDKIPAGSVCAVILHDRGERYMDTVYNDEWVTQHLNADSSSCDL